MGLLTESAMEGPFAWDPHFSTWAGLFVAVSLVEFSHWHLMRTSNRTTRWTRRQIEFFAGACVAIAVALGWPLADLAAHWSLTALVTQRLILILVVAPLLLLGLPYDVIQWISRPAFVDAALTRVRRPPVAIITVTVLAVGSMIPAVVQAQSTTPVIRGLIAVAIIGAGWVLWLPVLGRVPGVPRLKPLVRFGYLVAQAVIPVFLSFIFILSPHPLYATFAGSRAAIGLRPLNDQQIAGFVSKLTMLLVLLTVGAVILVRTPLSEEEMDAEEPLVWADVERQFERADRRRRKLGVSSSGAVAVADPDSEPQPATELGDPAGGSRTTNIDFTTRENSIGPTFPNNGGPPISDGPEDQ